MQIQEFSPTLALVQLSGAGVDVRFGSLAVVQDDISLTSAFGGYNRHSQGSNGVAPT